MRSRLILKRMAHSKLFIVGATITLAMCIIVILAPVLIYHDPTEANLAARLTPPQWFSAGREGNILGTDQMGRDILARLLIGAQESFSIAIVCIILSSIIGTAIGVIAGYYGGVLDQLLMRISEVFLAIPTMTLGIVVMAILGTTASNLVFVMVVTMWVSYAKLMRNNVSVMRNKEFVQASKVLGAKDLYIMFRQILPNITTPLIILLSQSFGAVILAEASLSFLYLGIQPPAPSWGNMIASGREYLTVAPWMSTAPGVMLMVTVLGFNFLGDGLRDVLDPKQQHSRMGSRRT